MDSSSAAGVQTSAVQPPEPVASSSIPTAAPSATTSAPAPSTAAPPAAAQAHPVPGNFPTKPPRILACVLCQHRKIKCDRSFPCANCLKANVTCTPSTPAPARKRRRPNQDLQERLARCEELLKEYATAKPGSPPSGARSPTNPAHPPSPRPDHIPELKDPIPDWKAAGKLVEEDGGVRFMDSYLLGTVYDEASSLPDLRPSPLKSMRQIVDEELACDEFTPAPIEDLANTPDDNSELIFGPADSPGITPEELTPSTAHIVYLWQIYLDRCNPLTKIVHVPTVQSYILQATSSSPHLPLNVEALLFSIYTLATVSLSREECEEFLGMSRDKALKRYTQGVRLTLTRMSFLRTHDLITLQALTIYLVSLQGRYNRHASWILNGLVIRIAQKMGLHRDGELLGLKPFETEMRRRLWWQIIMIDTKYALLSGLSNTLLPRSWDTKIPKNINDEDLLPSATEPIQDQEGPTDMILAITLFKMAKTIIQVPGFETILVINEMEAMKGGAGRFKEKVVEYKRLIGELDQDLKELFARFSSPTAGPLHQHALHIKNHFIGKFLDLAKPTAETPEWGHEVFDHTSNTFRLAVDTISHAVGQYAKPTYPGWDWFSRLHFQLDIFAYLVGQLCHRTTGRLVDRAWELVDAVYTYHPEFCEVSQKLYYQLAHFVFKAWRKREDVLRTRLGQPPEPPQCVQKLRQLMPGSDDSSVKSDSGRASSVELYHFVGHHTPSTTIGSMPEGQAPVGHGTSAFDSYMGNYFDFAAPLDFDMWGPTPTVPDGMPAMDPMGRPIQLQDTVPPYGMRPWR